MKRILTVITAALLCAASSHAQYIVYDPTLHVQNIIDEAENIAKFVMMIDNQVQQISTMTSQLQQLQQYNQAFGTPSQILNLAGFTGLISDLGNTGVGQAVGQLETLAQGINAEQYDGNGLYHNVGTTFTVPNGSSVSRDANLYRQFAAINETTRNFSNVYADVVSRRDSLRQDIAATTEQLRAAATASEVQKLTGILIGLNAELSATDKELDHAASVSFVQNAENQNDQAKQQQARVEEQQAEFSEGIQKYNNTLALSTEPATFPGEQQ
jgi:paraquat-inducible protein B